jgi:succinate dehydrogenase flavin-adding protein (antitoxin of CptAB toxin-antitoxin module)
MNTTQASQPDIFTRLGMVSASEEQKQAIAEKLADLTMVRVLDKISGRLSQEQMGELESLMDKNDDSAVEDRLVSWVPGYSELVERTAREVADQLVEDQRAVLAKVREQAAS